MSTAVLIAVRIYRIDPEDFQQPAAGAHSQLSTSELVALLESPNGWRRDTASRLLYERQDSAAIKPLSVLAVKAKLPQARMTARYSLAGLNALSNELIISGLTDSAPEVRLHALRLRKA